MCKSRILFIMQTDYFKPVRNLYNWNSGDMVYYISGISMFYSDEINSKFYVKDVVKKELEQNANWAKENFDIAITMEANIFASCYKNTLIEETEFIKSLKIPIFVLGAGCQSDINYSLEFLKDISNESKKYLDSILSSGGDITLRGQFTKFALEQLGFNNLFVSGCPSLFLLEKDFKINNNKVSRDNFKPMLSGTFVSDISNKIYKDFPNATFFDQDLYFNILYGQDSINLREKKYKKPFYSLYKQNRIKGSMNYYQWIQQIKNGKYNFSYGSRIHGNVIALQNKIPAFVKIIDSRTRELSEFYNIPNSLQIKFNEKKDDLYDLYLHVDYSAFNKTFIKKWNNFFVYLEQKNIPNCLNNNQKYINYLASLSYFNYEQDENIQKYKKSILSKFIWYRLTKFIK